jgi:hypothetical protein
MILFIPCLGCLFFTIDVIINGKGITRWFFASIFLFFFLLFFSLMVFQNG